MTVLQYSYITAVFVNNTSKAYNASRLLAEFLIKG